MLVSNLAVCLYNLKLLSIVCFFVCYPCSVAQNSFEHFISDSNYNKYEMEQKKNKNQNIL